MKKLAELRWPPPVTPLTGVLATAGSALTMAMKVSSRCCIIWNELPWSACTLPTSTPVSCCGKKVFGIVVYRYTLSATTPSSDQQRHRLVAQRPDQRAAVAVHHGRVARVGQRLRDPPWRAPRRARRAAASPPSSAWW